MEVKRAEYQSPSVEIIDLEVGDIILNGSMDIGDWNVDPNEL